MELVIVAIVAGVFGTVQTVLNLRASRKLGRIETQTNATNEEVRTRNGRTLAQTVEDTVDKVDELGGDIMELAIQFARHMNDDHSHAMVARMRQTRRDRAETMRTVRELDDDPDGGRPGR